ncbi:jg21900 [Pararge aegeria aegeria]|uniref:Malate dehydrogenase, mitochondrial n=1 Tax=Pararge aegeria aegeria TaxID=348720 RepID=A0A8S4RQQ9_9NEOP|nr:jg21900 [Pararge aegeria aegeria]
MLRGVLRKSVPKWLFEPNANHHNYVSSDILAQIEKECDRYCPVPRIPPHKDPSSIRQSLLKLIHNYHILTCTKTDRFISTYPHFCPNPGVVPRANKAFTNEVLGKKLWPSSSAAVLVYPVQFKPKGILQVTVIGGGSDVGRIVSLFLKQQKIIKVLSLYDEEPENNVLGVATDLAHMDTSTTVEAYQGRVFMRQALTDADVVLICGGHYLMPPCCCTLDRDLFFQNMQFVRTATIACAQFCPQAVIALQTPPVDCNFALCVDVSLFEKPTFIDSALVEQNEPEQCYNMRICATPVTVGKEGIIEYAIPKLNETETLLLEDSKCDLEDMLNLGSCYAMGDEYCLHPCKMSPCCYYPPPCKVCKPCEQ